ncbi:universal stress protein [Stutzerimonas kirkiae]|uniref:Universal stress protein n=1 Tax=Stutzerimonas kirkiae TaxID=2211392 RepID=A0A4Q9RF93_9GAMM|nr:universal stress protein [Stutzerimonas kirkiae]TBU99340.1 universal stress protein [Stutzerimonas kirkiae]TBV05172.1 universal stress protein [Stutzerimonas kirkiae]TBV06200.1 universal stress protein [Stutzerimonas kirkiae]TBV11891.1 universal stress protein [Stutzerimonas kirkiae]
MVQHILVAHDLSQEADIALRRGAQLAHQMSAHLSLVHVLAQAQDETQARAALQKRLQANALGDLPCWIRQGSAVEEVLTQARGLEAALLVLGQHHRQSPRGFAGTTLERILLGSDTPLLLVIRNNAQPYTRALAALDFSGSADRALHMARRLLPDGAELHALHIHETTELHATSDDELALQRSLFEQLLEDNRQHWPVRTVQMNHSLVAGERGRRLEEAVAQRQPQLLAMGASRRAQMSSALLGSLTREVLQQPPCDILVAP